MFCQQAVLRQLDKEKDVVDVGGGHLVATLCRQLELKRQAHILANDLVLIYSEGGNAGEQDDDEERLSRSSPMVCMRRLSSVFRKDDEEESSDEEESRSVLDSDSSESLGG